MPSKSSNTAALTYPGLPDEDFAFPTLVRDLLPVGLSGIVMAGLASGMLSHISSVLNSCSQQLGVFLLLQNIGASVAAPIAAVFLVGVLWRRATSAGTREIAGIIRSPRMAALAEEDQRKHRGLRSLFLWWAIFVGLMALLYAYMIWWQFCGPAKGL